MRPRFHYAPRAGWLSDPNGLVHHAGEWHMAYQFNPHGEDWGHMAWGHAVSRDLVDWTELPPALVEADGVMIYSGCAVIDHADSAGFGRDAIVAIYTGADERAGRQYQCLAFSTDRGRTWTKYAGNPVLDIGLADFRDPNVIWHAATQRWIMTVVLATENRAALYTSPNLRDWTAISTIAGDGAPGAVWECPLLIELPVEGTGERRWLFKVDVLTGAPGSGAIYRTGRFDGTHFIAEGPWRCADQGQDFYAAIAWHSPRDDAGRPLWIGWMGNHAVQKHLPQQGWRGAMSAPRRISLARDGQGYGLCQRIEPALLARLGAPQRVEGMVAPGLIADLQGSLSLHDDAGRFVTLAREADMLVVGRHDPFTPALDHTVTAPLPASAAITLLLDHGSIEVLSDDGMVALTMQHRLDGATWRAAVTR